MNNIINAVQKLKQQHKTVEEDEWFSCPLSVGGCRDPEIDFKCNCGAAEQNKRVEAVIAELKSISCCKYHASNGGESAESQTTEQLKAEIAALADELTCIEVCEGDIANGEDIIKRMRQLSAV